MVGLEVNRFGLVLENVGAKKTLSGTTPVLTVTGSAVNTSEERREAPQLRVVLRDEHRQGSEVVDGLFSTCPRLGQASASSSPPSSKPRRSRPIASPSPSRRLPGELGNGPGGETAVEPTGDRKPPPVSMAKRQPRRSRLRSLRRPSRAATIPNEPGWTGHGDAISAKARAARRNACEEAEHHKLALQSSCARVPDNVDRPADAGRRARPRRCSGRQALAPRLVARVMDAPLSSCSAATPFASDLLRAFSRRGIDIGFDALWLQSYADARESSGRMLIHADVGRARSKAAASS